MGCSPALACSTCRYDFFGHAETVIGQHSQPIRCVEFLKEPGLVATGSWDNTLRLWDPRLPLGKNCVSLIQLPGKAFSMAQSGSRMVVGTSGRHVLIYDLRRYATAKLLVYSHSGAHAMLPWHLAVGVDQHVP